MNRIKERDQLARLYIRDRYQCCHCGRPVSLGMPQRAHRIANTKANRKKFGFEIIDHIENWALVCSARCNDAMNIGNNPVECKRLLSRIFRENNSDCAARS